MLFRSTIRPGKWEVTQKDLPNNLQLGIYALAVSTAFPDKTIRAELYYLRSGKRKSHTFSPEDIEQVKVNLLSNINKIVDDNSFNPTSNERNCTFCDYGKSGVCATGLNRLKRMGKA